jgi:hypothetical protein
MISFKTLGCSSDPFVFFDRSESYPVDPSMITKEIEQMKKLYAAFWLSVNTTLRSKR